MDRATLPCIFVKGFTPSKSAAFLKAMQDEGQDRYSMAADPKFLNVDERDFRLQKDSPLLRFGFRQIDVREMGVTDAFPERYRRY